MSISLYVLLALTTGLFVNDVIAHSNTATLVEDFFQWRISEWPEYGTKVGINTYNNKLENLTEEAFLHQKVTAQHFLGRVNAINWDKENTEDRISLALLKDLLVTFINGYSFREYGLYNYMSPLDNMMYRLRKMPARMPKKTIQDYRNILDRYRLVSQQLTDMTELTKIAARKGTTSHTSSVDATIEELNKELKKNITDSSFFIPFTDAVMPDLIQEPERTTLMNEAISIITDEIFPSLTSYRNYLQNEYYPHARTVAGVSSLPGGLDYYKACLKWHISVDMTPEEVHQTGLKEVERILKNMETVMNKDGFSGTLQEYIRMLMADPDNFYTTSEGLLQGYKDLVGNIHGKLSSILSYIPDAAVDVWPSPQNVSRYSEPSADGSTPGIFWADVKSPQNKPKFNMAALTLHEAEPGHHTQFTYNLGRSNIPIFRVTTEYLRYDAVPFNWLFHTAYTEGWALYAESIGEEMGVYTQPHSLFGRYTSEMFRAVRLVVDTGIHAFGWTIEEAESYMKNYTTQGDITIRNEIYRYISWPGQACSYKIGGIKFRQLRELGEEKLGSRFDLKQFHAEVLSLGAVPLSILEDHVNNWINRELTAVRPSSDTVTIQSAELLTWLCLFMSVIFIIKQ